MMLMIECGGTFQPIPSYTKFGDFRRLMWGWFAITVTPYDINQLFEGIAHAAIKLRDEGVLND